MDAVATATHQQGSVPAAGCPGRTPTAWRPTGASTSPCVPLAPCVRAATVHIALAEVPRADPRVAGIADRADGPRMPRSMSRRRASAWRASTPRGEHGLFAGKNRVIRPRLRLPRRGIDAAGLFLRYDFRRAIRGVSTSSVACYHDQGLIPVKLVASARQ